MTTKNRRTVEMLHCWCSNWKGMRYSACGKNW